MSIRLEIPEDAAAVMVSAAEYLLERAKGVIPVATTDAVATPDETEAMTQRQIDVDLGSGSGVVEALAAAAEHKAEAIADTTAEEALAANTNKAIEHVGEQLSSALNHNALDVDQHGRPWDARIHSSGRTINKKEGHWNTKRGVTPELKAQVEAELDAVPASEPFVANPPPAGQPSVANGAPEITFITLAEQIGALGAANKIGPTTLSDLVSPYGATAFPDIADDKYKEMYPAIAATLTVLLNS